VGEGFKTGGKLAIGVITAAIKDALLFAYFLYQLTATLGTINANFNLIGFSIFTLGVTATG